MQKQFDFPAGEVLLIDKPLTWSSFDAVKYIRGYLRRGKVKAKIGHAGTLDPLATGLLILCTGKMTKKISFIQETEKEYTGTLKLGETTPSYDAEQEPDAFFPTEHITEEAIKEATKSFSGWIKQQVPIFSAVKQDGKRLFKLARQGKVVEPKTRIIEVVEFEITKVEMPFVDFRVRCSKGTYIRSLAHDLGKLLNSGAHLTALRRTKIGDHSVEDAWDIKELGAVVKAFVDGQKTESENADT
ncbi:UNVERIFIED_CONTAM: hypothetical protein GTU68_042104 [Idotea baltica]|nr:hypothetical protein [Idotea baltica]